MNKLAKRMVSMTCAAAVLLSFAACGGNADSDGASDSGEKKVVTLSFLNSIVPGEAQSSAYRAVLKEFLEKNTDIQLDEESIANADMATKVQTLAAADELPDLFMVKGSMAESFVESEKLLSVSEILDKYPDYRDNFKDGVFSNFTFDNKIYAIPYQVTNTCVFYNETLFQKAGISEFPTTWDGLLEAVEKLKAAGVNPIVLGNKDKWNAESVILSTLGNRCTGDEWYQNIRDRGGAKFTDPEFVLSLSALNDLAKAGGFNTDVNSIDGAQQRQVYMNGGAAMTIDGTWAISDLDAKCPKDILEATRIAALPSVEGGKGNPQAISGGSGWGVAVNAKIDTAKLPTVERFLTGVMGKDFATGLTQIGSISAAKPGDYKRDENALVANRFEEFQQDRPFVPVYDHQLSSGIMEVMQSGLQELLIGAISPEDLAASIQAEYERG